MKVELVSITPLINCAKAASNCYDSIPSEKIIDHCQKSGHHSVLEFCNFQFHVEGVSRALTHQLVRHRIASYAQRSQRYVNEKMFEYITPPTVQKIERANYLYDIAMACLQETYEKLIQLGIPAEDARFVLPNACETKIDINMNLRSLINFENERLCSRSQWEIRNLAREMKRVVVEVEPKYEKFLKPKCESFVDLPFCTGEKSCGKHPKLADIYEDYYKYKDLQD